LTNKLENRQIELYEMVLEKNSSLLADKFLPIRYHPANLRAKKFRENFEKKKKKKQSSASLELNVAVF